MEFHLSDTLMSMKSLWQYNEHAHLKLIANYWHYWQHRQSHSCMNSFVKDTLKPFYDFKNKQKSVWSNVFWYVKVCIFWKYIQYTAHWDKTQMLKKNPSDKMNGTKNVLFFLSRAPTHHSFTLICDSYMSWSTRFFSLKLCLGFSIFDSFRFY